MYSRAPPGREVKGPVSLLWTILQPEIGRLWGGVGWGGHGAGAWIRG